MEQITYKNVVEKIMEKLPEYKNSEKYFDESNKALQYIVLGNLASMAFEDVDNKNNKNIGEKLVKFTDEIMNSSDSSNELINLFQVQVFEQLVGSKTGAKLAKNLLHGKSLDLLEQTLEHYNTKDFLEEYRKNNPG